MTVVRYTPSHFQVLATDGDVHLGGIDWNDRLVDYVAAEFKSRARHSIRASRRPRCRCCATTPTRRRSRCRKANVATISCRHEGKATSVQVTRDQFEEMTADLLQRTSDTAQLVLEQAEVTAEQLDAVVLVGGSTLMPKVPTMLKQLTGQGRRSRAFRRTRPWPRGPPFTRPFWKPSSAANRANWPNASANCCATSSKRTSTRTDWAWRPATPRPAKRSITS